MTAREAGSLSSYAHQLLSFILPRAMPFSQILKAIFVAAAITTLVTACKPEKEQVSIKTLEAMAEEGSVRAIVDLALRYEEGDGVKQDTVKAMTLFLEAAERGNPGAQFVVGNAYRSGDGLIQDDAKAMYWFELSAAQGLHYAQLALGQMWDAERPERAFELYLAAAEQGLAQAQFNTGSLYESGYGVEQDLSAAVRWYLKAAEQGNKFAMQNLGELYAEGKGVPQNQREAIKWLKRAAEAGLIDAQYKLGIAYLEGVTKDARNAYIWLSVAAANGFSGAARYRDKAAEDLNPKQLSEAQAIAGKFFELYQSD